MLHDTTTKPDVKLKQKQDIEQLKVMLRRFFRRI
jgi:hypothetical protein